MTRRAPSLVLALLLASCASTHEAFTVSVLRPAPIDLSKHELVALDRFTGESSDAFVAELRAALDGLRAPLQGARAFELVSRAEVDRMIEDIRRYPNAKLGDDPQSPLAKWKRARIQLSGAIQSENVSEDITGQAWTDKNGQEHTTFVRSAKAQFAITIDVKSRDGSLLDRTTIRETSGGATKAVDTEPNPIDHDALLVAARRQALEAYLRRIAPYEDKVRVTLFSDRDLPQLQVGNGFARIGDWNSAFESYREAQSFATGELEPVTFKAVYNQGVALLYLNRFDDARAAFKRAYVQSQDRSILEQMSAVAQRESEYEMLQDQGAAAAPQN